MTDKARSYQQGCDVVPPVRTGARAMHQDYGSALCITPPVDADSAAAAIDVQGLWHCGQSIGESSKYVIRAERFGRRVRSRNRSCRPGCLGRQGSVRVAALT
jgi:hypothetical protein